MLLNKGNISIQTYQQSNCLLYKLLPYTCSQHIYSHLHSCKYHHSHMDSKVPGNLDHTCNQRHTYSWLYVCKTKRVGIIKNQTLTPYLQRNTQTSEGT